jgi:hypothetical protein
MGSALFWGITHRSGNYIPTFRDIISVPSSRVKESKKKVFFLDFFILEEGTDMLFRNVGTELQLYGASYPRRAKIS